MIALEQMRRVDSDRINYVPTSEWNWTPNVADPSAIDKSNIEASGGRTTSRRTNVSQTDHGENY